MTFDIRALEEAGKAVEENRKNLQTLLEQRTTIVIGQRENNIVLEEFGYLNPTEDVVMKQVGPTLIKEELDAAKQNVQQRLEFMANELKTIDAKIEDAQKACTAAESKLQQMQSSLK